MFRLSLLKHKSGLYDKNTYTQLEYECKGRPYFTISSHYVCKKKKRLNKSKLPNQAT